MIKAQTNFVIFECFAVKIIKYGSKSEIDELANEKR
jgi:hypothetical protein